MGRTYASIKELVFDCVHRANGAADYESVTAEVCKHFPESKWQRSHWAWYRSQIKQGRFKDEFSPEERSNLDPKKTEEKGERSEVKRVGDAILEHARLVMDLAAGDDVDLRFKLNRWVYARLQLDERRAKSVIKKELWRMGMTSCCKCNKRFPALNGVHIHREDGDAGYSLQNCILLCRPCHQKLHRLQQKKV